MNRTIIIGVTLLMANGWLGLNTSPAGEATKGAPNEANFSHEKGEEGTVPAVSLLHHATELARYARENESPEAMLTAVQMLRRVRWQEIPARAGTKQSEPQEKGEQAKSAQKGPTPAPSLDAAKLLAEAKVWAKGNEHIVALIDAELAKPSATGTLGAKGGPIVHSDRVLARSADNYTIRFRGREAARVVVIGDGDTDLDLYVYDENGNLIGSDTNGTDNCVVEWTPRWTGPFRVRTVNWGYVYNNYVLMTN